MAHHATKITPLPTKQPAWLIDIKPEDLMDEQPCGLSDVVRMLGVSREKVVEYVKTEELPGRKMGNRWEFYPSLVRAWRVNRQLKKERA